MTLKPIEPPYNRVIETCHSWMWCTWCTNPLWLFLTLSIVSDKSHAHRIKCHFREREREWVSVSKGDMAREKTLKLSHYYYIISQRRHLCMIPFMCTTNGLDFKNHKMQSSTRFTIHSWRIFFHFVFFCCHLSRGFVYGSKLLRS